MKNEQIEIWQGQSFSSPLKELSEKKGFWEKSFKKEALKLLEY